mmetsp:Transcript_4411/g.12226  ORF Transcript_4411/g.12226 Transcript_4411/m.12226 type:complete len:302 (+) Transcript_4411:123-1028(+)|eukprot:CAMPEP_0168729130 /NCGR_PEP_ID=MMETSP0724-20121128/6038_1 /TAXON_ID=265536 /ORGANISM="Amphiprora sp., Strain CCMP467" /LENGTH=301 /DNA_ID=CAMNT_0008775991 /DNA_START=50 /DNA_END=955 /DNA_ORIENTATION=+
MTKKSTAARAVRRCLSKDGVANPPTTTTAIMTTIRVVPSPRQRRLGGTTASASSSSSNLPSSSNRSIHYPHKTGEMIHDYSPLLWRRRTMVGSRHRAVFSSTTTGKDDDDESAPLVTTTTTTSGHRQRRRQRHRFDQNQFLDDIPSFETFQLQQQTRRLYRQFLRLIYQALGGNHNHNHNNHDKNNNNSSSSSSSRDELLQQVRRQFRSANAADPMSNWDVKRAHSEGGKRLKELSSLLGHHHGTTSSGSSPKDDQDTVEPQQQQQHWEETKPVPKPTDWPWRRQSAAHSRPNPIPRKSGV